MTQAGARRRRHGPARRGPGLAEGGRVPEGSGCPGSTANSRCSSSRTARRTSPTCCGSATGRWCCDGRRSGASRPARTTWHGSTGCCPGSGGPSRPRREPAAVRGPRASSARRSSSWSSAPAWSSGTRSPSRCATIADVARRVGFAVVRALADLHQVDYASCGLADLGRPDGFVARQVRGWRDRWEAVAHGAAATAQPLMLEVADTLERTLPRAAALRDPAQRPQAGQLPVRSRRPRPGALGVRLGHGDARGSPGGRRDPAQLLAGSRRRARRPGDVPGRPGERSACPATRRSSPPTPARPAST